MELNNQEAVISNRTSWLQNLNLKYHAKQPINRKILIASQPHERKFKSLLREHCIFAAITHNPNDIITNLSGDQLTNEELSILRFGLKHNLARRPNETDIIATAESIWDQLTKKTTPPRNIP